LGVNKKLLGVLCATKKLSLEATIKYSVDELGWFGTGRKKRVGQINPMNGS